MGKVIAVLWGIASVYLTVYSAAVLHKLAWWEAGPSVVKFLSIVMAYFAWLGMGWVPIAAAVIIFQGTNHEANVSSGRN